MSAEFYEKNLAELAKVLHCEPSEVFYKIAGRKDSEEAAARMAVETNLWRRYLDKAQAAKDLKSRINHYKATGNWGYLQEEFIKRAEARKKWHYLEDKSTKEAIELDNIANGISPIPELLEMKEKLNQKFTSIEKRFKALEERIAYLEKK
jgi:collagenase-like PrtC family protease